MHAGNLGQWPKESFVWTTQFNDLRQVGRKRERKRTAWVTLARELKFQALFQNRIVIRDADLVNHVYMMEMVGTNFGSIGHALQDGSIKFALREGAQSFWEVNERTGIQRAYPARFRAAQKHLRLAEAAIDRYGAKVQVEDFPTHGDLFRKNLERVYEKAQLVPEEKVALGHAIEHAATAEPAGPLRFGRVYQHLVKVEGYESDDELLQWCRACHVLTIPQAISVAPSALDEDLSPDKVKFVLGLSESSGTGDYQWGRELPEKILSESALDGLDFADIKSLRRFGEEAGYFQALNSIREAEPGLDTERAFITWSLALDRYLIEIGRQSDLRLVPWQSQLIRDEIEALKLHQVLQRAAVPLVVGAGHLTFMTPVAHAFALASKAVVQAAAMAVPAMDILGTRRKQRSLGRLIQGSTAYQVVR